MELPEIKLSEIKSMTAMLKSKAWRWGIILAFLGMPFCMLSQFFIGITLAQPLTLGPQLAFAVLLEMRLLNEKIEKIGVIGFVILITSPILLGFRRYNCAKCRTNLF